MTEEHDQREHYQQRVQDLPCGCTEKHECPYEEAADIEAREAEYDHSVRTMRALNTEIFWVLKKDKKYVMGTRPPVEGSTVKRPEYCRSPLKALQWPTQSEATTYMKEDIPRAYRTGMKSTKQFLLENP